MYFAQIFTSAKSFTSNPIIGSYWLNKLGLHVARVTVAALLTRIRYALLSPFATRDQRQAYLKDGYLVISDFLSATEFKALRNEVDSLTGEVRQCIQGDTLTQRILLTERVLEKMPACNLMLGNKWLLRLLKFTAARNNTPMFYVQNIKSNVVKGNKDPQRSLHSDTFHATMKAWLFLDEVSEKNGPFTYVPGSHKLTLKRLKWEYERSLQGSSIKNSYGARGSLRIDKSELEQLGLPEPRAFNVPPNTLVIANTHGFHCRGEASEVSSRMEIWAYSRSNPFNPLPGFGFNWYKRLSHFAIEKYLARQDRLAMERGMLSSWHRVDNNALHTMPQSHETQEKAKSRVTI